MYTFTKKDLNYRCKNANDRIILLDLLMSWGFRWHGDSSISALNVEEMYSFKLFPIIGIQYPFYLCGHGFCISPITDRQTLFRKLIVKEEAEQ